MVNYFWTLTEENHLIVFISWCVGINYNLLACCSWRGNTIASVFYGNAQSLVWCGGKKKKKTLFRATCRLTECWLMIHNRENSQWSYERALSVLIRGRLHTNCPLACCGNSPKAKIVNTRSIKLRCGQVMAVSACVMRCGPAWLTFNRLFGQDSEGTNCLLVWLREPEWHTLRRVNKSWTDSCESDF